MNSNENYGSRVDGGYNIVEAARQSEQQLDREEMINRKCSDFQWELSKLYKLAISRKVGEYVDQEEKILSMYRKALTEQ